MTRAANSSRCSAPTATSPKPGLTHLMGHGKRAVIDGRIDAIDVQRGDTVREIVAVDIGATNARFACATFEDGVPTLGPIRKYRVADFGTFNDCWDTYVRDEAEVMPSRAVIGLASPIVGDEIRLTNGQWTFRPKTIAEELGLESVKLVNDFAAVAHAIASLPLDEMELLFGPDTPLPRNGTVAVLGPGTGLGVAILVYNNGNPQISSDRGRAYRLCARRPDRGAHRPLPADSAEGRAYLRGKGSSPDPVSTISIKPWQTWVRRRHRH